MSGAEAIARKPRPSSRFERAFRRQGFQYVAGVDEAGRGSLFGPVVASAVILDASRPIRGLNDSKQLAPERRTLLAQRIRERALAVAVGAADSGHIDYWNIYHASARAMREAVSRLDPAPHCLLVDAMKIDFDLPQRAVIGGDGRCFSIAAASIIAKVERDRWMARWDAVFPEYGLASNKGYATPDHLRALERFGPTPLHRRSFRPVADRERFACANPALGSDPILPLFDGLQSYEMGLLAP